MRELATRDRIERFMAATGSVAARDGVCYFTGGATAVLLGWRDTTLDIDVAFDPEQDEVLRELPTLKQELQVNVELASPGDFVPLPKDWRARAISIERYGRLTFAHFDPYAQALAKLERAYTRDLEDVRTLIDTGLVEPLRLRAMLDEIEPELYRYPAIDPRALRQRVEAFT